MQYSLRAFASVFALLTVAAAYLVDIKGAFNIGVLAGSDIYSKSQNVPTSNKLWLACRSVTGLSDAASG